MKHWGSIGEEMLNALPPDKRNNMIIRSINNIHMFNWLDPDNDKYLQRLSKDPAIRPMLEKKLMQELPGWLGCSIYLDTLRNIIGQDNIESIRPAGGRISNIKFFVTHNMQESKAGGNKNLPFFGATDREFDQLTQEEKKKFLKYIKTYGYNYLTPYQENWKE